MSVSLPEGALLQGGRYEIARFIGSGGFGCTYEARHVPLGKRVAIKEFFVSDFCNRDGQTMRVTVGTESKRGLVEKLRGKFIDEARSLARLAHKGIVSVSDVFEENGTAYYVMDYIEGQSLDAKLRRSGPMPEGEALRIIRQVCQALGYVHAHNCLHLDIKPGNIMLGPGGDAVLIDFGAAKQYEEVNGENTSTLVGRTPGYAPLEQMSDSVKTFYPATDIYAVGATLHKLLTGETPPSATDLASGDASLPPLPAGVSGATAAAMRAAMRLKRADRPQSTAEFLTLLGGKGVPDDSTVIDTAPPVPKPKPAPKPKPVPAPEPEPEPKFKWKAKYAYALLAVILVAAIFIHRNRGAGEGGPGDEVTVVEEVGDSSGVVKLHLTREQVDSLTALVHKPVSEAEPLVAEGGLSVQYTPSGAAVYVDGSKKGKTPCEISGLQPGSHTVKISLSGYESVSRTIEVKANVTREISGALAALAASSASAGSSGGHEWVDLGLSVKWATCNVGASSPEGYGNYYAWGETSTKSSYDEENCATYEKQIGDIAGTSRDVAHAKWGSPWRMPTMAEFQELFMCTWTWTTRNGVNGYKVTGPDGNSIFLPSAGSRYGTSLYGAGEWGDYWSSTPYEDDTSISFGPNFEHDDPATDGFNYRYLGYTVRPVTE